MARQLKITRYNYYGRSKKPPHHVLGFMDTPQGEWVKYEDVAPLLAELSQLSANKPLCADGGKLPSLRESAESILNFKFVGDCDYPQTDFGEGLKAMYNFLISKLGNFTKR